MISDKLLYDIALDWRKPYFKVKLKGDEQLYYAQFGLLYPKTFMPMQAQIDTYTENNWLSYMAGNKNAIWTFKNITSWEVESLEIIMFQNDVSSKPKKFKTIKEIEQMYVPHILCDTLKKWNLKAMGIIKNETLWKQFNKGIS